MKYPPYLFHCTCILMWGTSIVTGAINHEIPTLSVPLFHWYMYINMRYKYCYWSHKSWNTHLICSTGTCTLMRGTSIVTGAIKNEIPTLYVPLYIHINVRYKYCYWSPKSWNTHLICSTGTCISMWGISIVTGALNHEIPTLSVPLVHVYQCEV